MTLTPDVAKARIKLKRADKLPPTVRTKARPPSSKRAAVPTRDRLLVSARAEFAQHGFAGARIDRILAKAKANPRMLYHHFGGKAEIYVAVLEAVLGDLREIELNLDVIGLDPLDGLLQLFDFMNDHFESNPSLVSLFVHENVMKAKFMRTSAKIQEMSSPVLDMIARFLEKGAADRKLAEDLDPLRVYVLMVALSQFHLSNVHTLSIIFDRDLSRKDWRAARKRDARRMLCSFLQPQ